MRKQLMAGYVDDTSINISKTHGSNIRKEMRKEIQKWEEALHATGEKFEMTNCF